MSRYVQVGGGPKGENPREWGTLTEEQVQGAVLMESPRPTHSDRYIAPDDVERLTAKGWKVKGGDHVYAHAPAPVKRKPGRPKGANSETVTT